MLRPTGAFAAWGYDLSYFPECKPATALMREYYEWLNPYWSDRRTLIDEQYRGEGLAVCSAAQTLPFHAHQPGRCHWAQAWCRGRSISRRWSTGCWIRPSDLP